MVSQARALGRQRLADVSETPDLDSDLLLEHVTGLTRTAQIIEAGAVLTPDQASRFRGCLERRRSGEPVAYIVGSKHFRSIELAVDRRVLVPRPETELLVEVALAALPPMAGDVRVIDLGTGSGAIALSLADELPPALVDRVEITASDISQDALGIAAANCKALGLDERVRLIESDLLDDVEGDFDLILANLPYLRHDQRHPSTRAEPDLALYAGSDGLDQYRRLLLVAGQRMTRQGLIACEIDPGQRTAMLDLAQQYIGRDEAILSDLAGHDRILIAGPVDIVRTVIETWPYGA